MAKRKQARSASKRTSGSAKATRSMDAIKLLKQDHREVEALFTKFESARSAKQQEIAATICRMLTVHARIEEEIFYPAARQALKKGDLVDEAEVEHASAKDLIAQIEGLKSGDDKFNARVTVLGEYIRHHVQEEEKEMFKQLDERRIDLDALGEQLMQRKQELLGEAEGGRPTLGALPAADDGDEEFEGARRGRGSRPSAPGLHARGGRRGGTRTG